MKIFRVKYRVSVVGFQEPYGDAGVALIKANILLEAYKIATEKIPDLYTLHEQQELILTISEVSLLGTLLNEPKKEEGEKCLPRKSPS